MIKNNLGQVINVGTVVVYAKTVGTMKFKMTPAVVIDVVDDPKAPRLVVHSPKVLRPVRHLTNMDKVVVVDINSLDIPSSEMQLLKQAIAQLLK